MVVVANIPNQYMGIPVTNEPVESTTYTEYEVVYLPLRYYIDESEAIEEFVCTEWIGINYPLVWVIYLLYRYIGINIDRVRIRNPPGRRVITLLLGGNPMRSKNKTEKRMYETLIFCRDNIVKTHIGFMIYSEALYEEIDLLVENGFMKVIHTDCFSYPVLTKAGEFWIKTYEEKGEYRGTDMDYWIWR